MPSWRTAELVKRKNNFTYCFTLPIYEDVLGSAGIDEQFLISALDGGEWSPSHPGLFTPGNAPIQLLEKLT
jgi:hypothetical protein